MFICQYILRIPVAVNAYAGTLSGIKSAFSEMLEIG